MPLTVVLAVGLDPSLLANRGSVWQSAGYLVTSIGSIKEAIPHIRGGCFDLVLLAVPSRSIAGKDWRSWFEHLMHRYPWFALRTLPAIVTALLTPQSTMSQLICCTTLEN